MDLQKIKTLLDFVGRSRVSELTVSDAGTTVVIRKSSPVAVAGSEPHAEESQVFAPPELNDEVQEPDVRIVRAATMGVLHQAQSPGAAPLIALGDRVEPGQALCIIEAMKVFTTINAPIGGTVKRIFFEDGQEVGFGDPLVEIC
ncbi:biotin carboxyl carrier protein of acetyl-CoA carboxylase [Sinorhizobium sp. KGO-5]|uniref:acetyl-CoA carboxylase biotin carboxyl carrier protein n=1 Tax=Sinorhizobium sp. KGO-5 TaxID=1470810 RepID=UPI0029492E46|nr:biotin carboxyl carrier protein of acetyl-CoA carboxylase [Sinorhizobium sp. KGO-5]